MANTPQAKKRIRRNAKRAEINHSRVSRIRTFIKAVLQDAIRAGGSTLRDYKRADGSVGAFQNEFQVYGREGEPCARRGCRGIVRRKTQGGRSTFYCPACQR